MRNMQFKLIANDGGHASQSTLMTFDDSTKPFKATYTGPNVKFGHVIVEGDQMLYHALDSQGNLSAGAAAVTLTDTHMILAWRWLTGDLSKGESRWQRVDS